MLRRVAFVRTDFSEELSASFIRVTRNGEPETTLAVTSNRRTLRRNRNVLEGDESFHDLMDCVKQCVMLQPSLFPLEQRKGAVRSDLVCTAGVVWREQE
jgi:hypothetical protein